MTSVSIPMDVLGDALVAAIDGRRLRTAVFTTFTFDPGDLEEKPSSYPLAGLFRLDAGAETRHTEEDVAMVVYPRYGSQFIQ